MCSVFFFIKIKTNMIYNSIHKTEQPEYDHNIVGSGLELLSQLLSTHAEYPFLWPEDTRNFPSLHTHPPLPSFTLPLSYLPSVLLAFIHSISNYSLFLFLFLLFCSKHSGDTITLTRVYAAVVACEHQSRGGQLFSPSC